MWPVILLIFCGATPIFGPQPENPWDALHDVFYTHQFTNGKTYVNEHALDSAPWSTWAPFYNDDKFYAHVVNVLDAFAKQPAAEVERQSPIRRAIMLRDLWAVFDAQATDRDADGAPAKTRRIELRNRLARIMRRLELSEEEASHLPDNLQAILAEKSFPRSFDEQSPEKPFIPPDLFADNGPWVAMARGKKTVGALGHLESADFRSIFVPYLRVSDKRQDTLDFLTEYQKANKTPPKGSQFALVRRMAVPTTSGRMVATPVVESLQFIAVDRPRDHHFKFVLDRAALIAGRPGLRPLTSDDPVDAYAFEAGGLFPFDSKSDSDGERLVLGEYAGPVPEGITSLGHCIMCHANRSALFVNFGNGYNVALTTAADEQRRIIAHKEESPAWKAYQAARK